MRGCYTEESISEPGAYIVAAKRKAGFYTKTTGGGKSCSKKGLKNVIKCFHSHMCMKAVVNVVGEGKGKVNTRIGHPMEIIPLVNSGDLREGDYLPVHVFFKGEAIQRKDICYICWFHYRKGYICLYHINR